jgi:hypothetical protein
LNINTASPQKQGETERTIETSQYEYFPVKQESELLFEADMHKISADRFNGLLLA